MRQPESGAGRTGGTVVSTDVHESETRTTQEFWRGAVNRLSVRREIVIEAAPDEVWAVVGDAARLADWWPGLQSVTVEGTMRTIVTGSGLPMPEQILTIDPIARRFQYRLESPIFTEHLSTIDVHDLGGIVTAGADAGTSADTGRSLVVYSVDAEPAIMALVIGGAGWNGLQRLQALVEAGLASDDETEEGGD